MNEQSAEKSSIAYEMWMLICLLILIKWFIFLFAYIRKLCKPYQEFCWGPAADQANKTPHKDWPPIRGGQRIKWNFRLYFCINNIRVNACLAWHHWLQYHLEHYQSQKPQLYLCVTAACSFATPGVTQGCYLFGWALLLSQPSSTAQGSDSTYLNGNKVSIQLCCCCVSQHILVGAKRRLEKPMEQKYWEGRTETEEWGTLAWQRNSIHYLRRKHTSTDSLTNVIHLSLGLAIQLKGGLW